MRQVAPLLGFLPQAYIATDYDHHNITIGRTLSSGPSVLLHGAVSQRHSGLETAPFATTDIISETLAGKTTVGIIATIVQICNVSGEYTRVSSKRHPERRNVKATWRPQV